MASTVLLDVVAYVLAADAVHNAKAALQQRLERHGAKVVQRLCKEVTHVVFERKRSQRARDRAAEEAEILGLYRRLEAMEHPPLVVSPLWVEQSLEQKRRLIETKFTVARPKENMLAPVGKGSAGGKKRRQLSTAGKPPKPSEAFDIDDSDWMFSSSQQIHAESDPEGGPPEAPDPRPPSKRSTRQPRGKAAATKAGSKAAAGRKQEAPQPEERLLQVGSATQAVADILAIDLPGDAADEVVADELDTPLGVRFARHSLGKRPQLAGGEKTAPAAAAPRRSRLAKASGPAKDGNGKGGGENRERLGGMQPLPATHVQRPTASGGAPGEAPPASLRFSVRQLQSHPERPVAIHKGTPLPGAMPRPAAHQKTDGSIPIPVVDRVESPWNTAAALPLSQGGSQPEARPAVGAAGKRAGGAGPSASARPSLGSRLGSVDAKVHRALAQGMSGREHLPSPWSAQRPWDAKGARAEAAAPAEKQRGAEAGAGSAGAVEMEAEAAEEDVLPPQHAAGGSRAGGNKRSRRGAASRDPGAVQLEAGGKRRKQGAAADLPGARGGCERAAVAQGFVSTTSCGSAVEALCRSAVRRLRGLRMCVDGQEDGAVTHLVIGSERRTLKAMLAVANGAWLVTPEWVTASLEAGRWLPESRFPAKVRFVGGAQRARNLLDVPDAAPLLGDFAIHVHAGRGRQAAAGALRRVAAALGAKSVSAAPRSCTLCVVSGEGGCAEGLPRGVHAVREEWLWQAAERFEVPEVQDFLATSA